MCFQFFCILLSVLLFNYLFQSCWSLPSVLWRCWLGGRKGIQPVKKLSGGLLVWLSVWSEGADLHMAQLMPLPHTVSCYSKIKIGYTFLVLAHPGSPRKRAFKWVCVFQSCWLNSVLIAMWIRLFTDVSCLSVFTMYIHNAACFLWMWYNEQINHWCQLDIFQYW